MRDGTMTFTGILQEDISKDMGGKGALSLKPMFDDLFDQV